MKIFYAVQATGNGHISRAMTLLPYLQRFGSVDIFLSGDNSNLQLDAPIKYRSKGISLYYNCTGGLNYWQMAKNFEPFRLKQEIKELPVEKYDLVLNDFDYITSAACARKKVSSVHFGHQASFMSAAAPRPSTKNMMGEWLLKHYVKASLQLGFHFKSYDDFILPAIVKKEVLDATPVYNNYYVVYLPSYCTAQLKNIFQSFSSFRFHIFSKETTSPYTDRNMEFFPVAKGLFNESLINCSGIICGAGFETPAEALHLGKKILATPIRGQYEQQCNAAALQQLGVTCLSKIDDSFPSHFYKWIDYSKAVQIDYSKSIPNCLERLLTLAEKKCNEMAA